MTYSILSNSYKLKFWINAMFLRKHLYLTYLFNSCIIFFWFISASKCNCVLYLYTDLLNWMMQKTLWDVIQNDVGFIWKLTRESNVWSKMIYANKGYRYKAFLKCNIFATYCIPTNYSHRALMLNNHLSSIDTFTIVILLILF